MFNLKELGYIAIAIIIFAFVASFIHSASAFFLALLFGFIIISVNVLAKKIMAYYLDCYTQESLWTWQRYGFRKHQQFNFPILAGVIFPLVLSLVSQGVIKFLAFLEFDIHPATHRVAKRHGFYSYSELSELHIGIIAASGIFFNLVLSLIAFLLGFSELARLSIYFAVSNILPISNLDGAKVFFGNRVLWTVIATLCFLALVMSFVII